MTAVVHSGNAVRGCHCAHCDRRRRLNTQNARNAREQALAAAQFGQRLCPRRYGPGVCAGILETTIGSGGRTLVRCPRCERRKAGLCRDCNGRVEGEIGRASRCKECKRKFRNLVTARYVQANHDKVKAHSRAHYQNNPEIRARRNEYKRLYRKAHPEKVREQKRRYVAKYRERVTSKYAKYHARYRKKHQAYYRQLQNTRNALERKAPPKCTACGKSTRWKPIPGAVGRPWKTCNACARGHTSERSASGSGGVRCAGCARSRRCRRNRPSSYRRRRRRRVGPASSASVSCATTSSSRIARRSARSVVSSSGRLRSSSSRHSAAAVDAPISRGKEHAA
jgi:hypothetical protein